jgi:hypothetical protein
LVTELSIDIDIDIDIDIGEPKPPSWCSVASKVKIYVEIDYCNPVI